MCLCLGDLAYLSVVIFDNATVLSGSRYLPVLLSLCSRALKLDHTLEELAASFAGDGQSWQFWGKGGKACERQRVSHCHHCERRTNLCCVVALCLAMLCIVWYDMT